MTPCKNCNNAARHDSDYCQACHDGVVAELHSMMDALKVMEDRYWMLYEEIVPLDRRMPKEGKGGNGR